MCLLYACMYTLPTVMLVCIWITVSTHGTHHFDLFHPLLIQDDQAPSKQHPLPTSSSSPIIYIPIATLLQEIHVKLYICLIASRPCLLILQVGWGEVASLAYHRREHLHLVDTLTGWNDNLAAVRSIGSSGLGPLLRHGDYGTGGYGGSMGPECGWSGWGMADVGAGWGSVIDRRRQVYNHSEENTGKVYLRDRCNHGLWCDGHSTGLW